MIDRLPDGKSMGWMQAPPGWIFTHTVRFTGIVRVVIQDGEGFILIRKGKPLMYFFRHGRIELRGQRALDYFNSCPTIEFNLCKYTPQEFSRALKICEIDEVPQETVVLFEERTNAAPADGDHDEKPGKELRVPGRPEPPLPVQPEEHKPIQQKAEAETERSVAAVPVSPAPEIDPGPPVLQPEVLEEPDIQIVSQIKKLNGIIAISVFNDTRNILLMGDTEIEPLLKIARTMLATATRITPRVDWGSFVHMTLQIPDGNLIIAPYHENHLCILTTRMINIGHIRRILRGLHQDRNPGIIL